jgi:hypothetical protein
VTDAVRFSSTLVQPGEQFLCHQTRHCQFVWHRRNGECNLSWFWQVTSEPDARQLSTVNTGCTVKKTSLHSDCLQTPDGLGRAGYSITWPAWAVVQSQRYCVFVNAVELYSIATVNKHFKMGSVTFRPPSCFVYPCLISRLRLKFSGHLKPLALTSLSNLKRATNRRQIKYELPKIKLLN